MGMKYSIYIILPMLIGFWGERYKDISTKKYVVSLLFILAIVHVLLYFIDGGPLMPSQFEFALDFLVLIIATPLFHFQKALRKKAIMNKG